MPTSVQIVEAAASTGRVKRRPTHPFHIRHRPFQLTPFLIAPVLPGETMENLLVQARAITDPIKNPLIGWWYEQYFFYVKHRDLVERDALTLMHVDGTAPGWINQSLASSGMYTVAGGPDWVRKCLHRVTEVYFRAEGEPVADATTAFSSAATAPKAAVTVENWLDSAKDGTVVPAGDQADSLPGEGDTAYTPIPGFETHYAQWQHMRALKVVNMTFEDYLKSFGIRPPAPQREELHHPELIRYVRDWTYPSNTVEPTTGVPASMCNWSISERADKARFFAEPGFIFGVAVARPKVYLSGQKGNASELLNDAYAWLPAVMGNEAYTSLKQLAAAHAILPSQANATWVDLKDLFLYGDQFVNFDLTSTDAGLVALPAAGMQKRYVATADIDALFKASTANQIRADGRVDLTILSRLQETT